MIRFLRNLFALGMTDSLNTYDVCKLQIINRLTILCMTFLMLLIVINTVIGNHLGIVIDVLAITWVMLPVLYLNNKKHYQAAIYYFLIGIHAALALGAMHTLIESRANELELLLIPGAIAVIILLEGIGHKIFFVVNFIMLAILKYQRLMVADSSSNADYFKMLAIISIGYLGIYYFIIQFKTQLIRALKSTEELNEQLSIKEIALIESNKSKDRLFSIVAHDLRAPLGIIQSLLDPSMLESLDKDQMIKYQNDVRSRISVLQETMNNLLSWAQSQLGKVSVIPTNINLKLEVENVVSVFQEIIDAKIISLTIVGGEVEILFDKDHLNVVLRNIIHNAIKYTPHEGKIIIEMASKGNECQFSIKDSGVGINDETIANILNNQLSKSIAGTFGEKGSGVGMSFCHQLIKKNNSTLIIERLKETGSNFEVRIPIAK